MVRENHIRSRVMKHLVWGVLFTLGMFPAGVSAQAGPLSPARVVQSSAGPGNSHLTGNIAARIIRVANKRPQADLKLLYAFAEDRVNNPKTLKPAQQWVKRARRLSFKERTAEDNLVLAIHALSQGNIKKISEYAYAGLQVSSATDRVTAYLLIYLGLAFEKRDPKLARYNYLQSTHVDPTLFRGHFELARLHFIRDEFPQAEAELKQALARNPNHWVVYESFGKLYDRLKQYKKAAAFFEKALMRNSSAHWLWVQLGDIYFIRLQQKEKGGARYKEAVKQNGSFAKGRWQLGVYYQYRGDYSKAKKEWQAALRLDPNNPDYRFGLGGLYLQLNQPAKAVDQLRAGLKIDPRNIQARLQLGMIYENRKQFKRAGAEYDRVLQSDPQNPEARKRLQRIKTALAPPPPVSPPREPKAGEQVAQANKKSEIKKKVLAIPIPLPIPATPSVPVGEKPVTPLPDQKPVKAAEVAAAQKPKGPPRGSVKAQTNTGTPQAAKPPPAPLAPKPPAPVMPLPKRTVGKAQDLANFPADLRNEIRIPLGQGWTPLHYAAALGRQGRVRQLLKQGVSTEVKNEFARTPLYLAAKRGELEVVALLVQHGAKVNARESRGGYFPLHIAAGFGQVDVVRYLLKHGAQVDPRTYYGDTPLMEAVYNTWHKDNRILALLVQHRANIRAQNKAGCQALCYAAQRGNLNAVEYLLQQRAPIEARNNEGATPLFLAVMGNRRVVVKTLLHYGANPLNPSRGVSPLELAKIKKYLEIYVLLLDKAKARQQTSSK